MLEVEEKFEMNNNQEWETEEEGEQEKMRQKSRKRGSNPASGFFSIRLQGRG